MIMANSKIESSTVTSSSTELKVNAKRWLAMATLEDPKKNRKLAKIDDEAIISRSSAMDRALNVQASLEPHKPNFIKRMLKSHVSGGFWLSFVKPFCDAHLPKKDDTIILVDENQQRFEAKYLASKNGLSGGWRGYSIDHDLSEGDVLVFQLIQVRPYVFNVHTVRANESAKPNGTLTMSHSLQSRTGTKKRDYEKISEETSEDSEPNREPLEYESGDGIVHKFEGAKSFKYSKIELPKALKEKYLELCCSQNTFLHVGLIKNLNDKLFLGIISETVHIADSIRAAKPERDVDSLESWDMSLKGFEVFGMSVGFLRERIRILMDLSHEPRAMIESMRKERAGFGDEARKLESRLSDVRKSMERLDTEIEMLLARNKEMEFMFEQVARLPWARSMSDYAPGYRRAHRARELS